MLEMAVALATRNRTVAGHPSKVSLCDLGYCSVGVDEGWEACTAGSAPSRQHDAAGLPMIDATFPDMGGMVGRIHDLGLTVGWYLNGCKCGEHVELMKNYQGDVDSLHKFGFDVSSALGHPPTPADPACTSARRSAPSA
jgi:alpha-galactosidase